jgi:hypothetical protein
MPKPESPARRLQLLRVARAAASLVGLGCIIWLLRTVGIDRVTSSLRQAAPWIPLLMVAESLRPATELLAARGLLGDRARSVSLGVLIRAHLIAYSVSMLTPCGRPASEAAKAALLGRYVGGPTAAAMASSNQVLNLAGEAVLSAAGLTAACLYGGSRLLVLALLGHCCLCTTSAVLLRLTLRSRRLEGWLSRLRRLEHAAPEFRRAAEEQRLLIPALWFVAGKSMQLVLLALLFAAVGAGLSPSQLLLAQGFSSLASAVGDLIPAQLGTTDGIFAAGATAIGVSVSAAVSAALLLHCVQLTWAAIGALSPFFFKEANQAAHQWKAALPARLLGSGRALEERVRAGVTRPAAGFQAGES